MLRISTRGLRKDVLEIVSERCMARPDRRSNVEEDSKRCENKLWESENGWYKRHRDHQKMLSSAGPFFLWSTLTFFITMRVRIRYRKSIIWKKNCGTPVVVRTAVQPPGSWIRTAAWIPPGWIALFSGASDPTDERSGGIPIARPEKAAARWYEDDGPWDEAASQPKRAHPDPALSQYEL